MPRVPEVTEGPWRIKTQNWHNFGQNFTNDRHASTLQKGLCYWRHPSGITKKITEETNIQTFLARKKPEKDPWFFFWNGYSNP